LAGIFFVRMTVRAALAFSIAGSGYPGITSGLSDLGYVLTVVLSFPAAMFVMSGAFGLRRAGLISNRFFAAGVAAVVLVLVGGTTWASNGFWAPDGAYQFVSQLVAIGWIAVISAFLVRRPSTVSTPVSAAVPAA
jgi:hypothetical protein